MVQLKNTDDDFIAKLLREFITDLETGFNDYQESTKKSLETVAKLEKVLGINTEIPEVTAEKAKLEEHIKKQFAWYEEKKSRLEKALLLVMGGSDA